MKHQLPEAGTPAQVYRHPTPAEMRISVSQALRAIQAEGVFIPVQVLTAIDEGFSDACISAGLPS